MGKQESEANTASRTRTQSIETPAHHRIFNDVSSFEMRRHHHGLKFGNTQN
jgi:hypothetical protein